MLKRVCNMCGKDFNEWDEQEEFGFHFHVGYGSGFDGSRINMDFCCDCFDRMMNDYIIPNSKISPVEEV